MARPEQLPGIIGEFPTTPLFQRVSCEYRLWAGTQPLSKMHRCPGRLDPFRSGEVVHAEIPKPQQCPVDPPHMRTRLAVDYRRVNAMLKQNVDEFNHSD